jgi:hypothetical protein
VVDLGQSAPVAYRKKPVVVQAIRLGRENAAAVVAWINDHYEGQLVACMRGGPKGGSLDATVHITTLEGVMRADVGDYVIRGVHHEFYPCKPDVFDATYEAVQDGA